MDTERQEMAKKGPETRGVAPESQRPLEAERVAVQQEKDTASAVAERKKAAESAARATREMKDPLLVRVESLLSEGLADEYATLSPGKKQAFKQEGEMLAVWLHHALAKGDVKPHEVLARLEKWLLIIEGKDRSSPWLIQEAYVRARRAMREMKYEHIGH